MKDLFRFKQFNIYQDLAAMKVGTDGVLLGAWANFYKAKSILDIGTGTGLIALMAAQKNTTAQITAIEIDKNAFLQAQYNFTNAPWSDRLTLVNTALQDYKTNKKFDVIVSNPPYFDEQTVSKSVERQIARHTASLHPEELIHYSSQLMTEKGQCFFIFPFHKKEELIHIAKNNGLYLSAITQVKGHQNAQAKRILVALQKEPVSTKEKSLIIEISRHQYTREYIELTKDFYLKM